MRVLVLGGTQFLGRHIAGLAIERGWDVSLFNRGITNASLFPEAEHLIGDRLGDVSVLDGRSFDAVIDVACYHPSAIHSIKTGHYTFVSSISAYADVSKPGVNEDWPLASLAGDLPDEYDPEQYGALKVVSERKVASLFANTLIVRPGLIVGEHDTTDRFTYWPVRAARGGTILAPGRPSRQVQLIDARDLASWMLGMVSRSETGTFNATGPAETLAMKEMLDACIAAARTGATLEWVDEAWLLEQKVEPWSELPLWLPEDGEHAGMMAADVSRAIAHGLAFRPIEETARATLAWDRTRELGERKAGISAEREAELLTSR